MLIVPPIPTQDPQLYYVEGRPDRGHERLSDARTAAALMQRQGVHHSLPILQNGHIVDLKRF